MALTPSTMRPLKDKAPDFSLPSVNGKTYELKSFRDAKALVVAFICNHCPYVKHLEDGLIQFHREFSVQGVAFVAISSNNVETHPDDSFENMKRVSESKDYRFPYLYDETQQVAKDFRASCTPDFFVFDSDRKLVYRGQFDDSRPGNNIPVTGDSLKQAVQAVLNDEAVPDLQKPSVGCNIKWKAGNEPDYVKGLKAEA